MSEKAQNLYEVRVQGHLEGRRIRAHEEISVTHTSTGETILLCPVCDQAALYGLIIKLRDLGVPLVAVNRIEPDQN
jgi:hypothetical protein